MVSWGTRSQKPERGQKRERQRKKESSLSPGVRETSTSPSSQKSVRFTCLSKRPLQNKKKSHQTKRPPFASPPRRLRTSKINVLVAALVLLAKHAPEAECSGGADDGSEQQDDWKKEGEKERARARGESQSKQAHTHAHTREGEEVLPAGTVGHSPKGCVHVAAAAGHGTQDEHDHTHDEEADHGDHVADHCTRVSTHHHPCNGAGAPRGRLWRPLAAVINPKTPATMNTIAPMTMSAMSPPLALREKNGASEQRYHRGPPRGALTTRCRRSP